MSQVTNKELMFAVDTLNHQPAFNTLARYLDEVVADQTWIVSQGAVDPRTGMVDSNRHLIETGVLQGVLRVKQILTDPSKEASEDKD